MCNFRVEYIQLALEHKPLNLGQGFPDFAAPEHVTQALADVATGDNVLIHQYTRGFVINCSKLPNSQNTDVAYFSKGPSSFGYCLGETLFSVGWEAARPPEWNFGNCRSIRSSVFLYQWACWWGRWSYYHRALFWLLWTHGENCRRGASFHSLTPGKLHLHLITLKLNENGICLEARQLWFFRRSVVRRLGFRRCRIRRNV